MYIREIEKFKKIPLWVPLCIGLVTLVLVDRLTDDELETESQTPDFGFYYYLGSDPRVTGQNAPLYQLLWRTDSPSIFYKSGPLATDWTEVGLGGGAGTVTSPGMTINRLPKATAAQTIADTAFPCDDAAGTMGCGDSDADVATYRGTFQVSRTGVDSNPSLGIINDAQNWLLTTRGADSDNLSIFDATATQYRMRFLPGSTRYVGIGNGGNTMPIAPLEIYDNNVGQSTANLTDAGSRSGLLYVVDGGAGVGNGGGVLFGFAQSHTANSVGVAAIKALAISGAGNTTGDLAVSVRAATGDTALAERFRFLSATGNSFLATGLSDHQRDSGTAIAASAATTKVTSTTAVAQGVGGGIRLDGVLDAGTATTMALIKAYKANATSGNEESDIVMATRADAAADVSERFRVRGATGESFIATGNGSITGNFQIGDANGDLVTTFGHQSVRGTAPTLSSCGGSPTIVGTDKKGVITVGTAITTCTATFSRTYTTTVSCTVTARSGVNPVYTVSATALSLTTAVASDVYDYDCDCVGGSTCT